MTPTQTLDRLEANMNPTASASSPTTIRQYPLSFDQLREANVARAKQWRSSDKPMSVEFAVVELVGEVGELCNNVKKMVRANEGMAGGKIDMPNLRDELADVVICCDLLGIRLGIDLAGAVTEKFNATSNKHGFTITLPPSNPPESVPANPQQSGGDWRERCKVYRGAGSRNNTWNVDSPSGTLWLTADVGAEWYPHSQPCYREIGTFNSEEAARAALAKAPQPPDIKPGLSGESKAEERCERCGYLKESHGRGSGISGRICQEFVPPPQPKADPAPVVEKFEQCVTCHHPRDYHMGEAASGTTACSVASCSCSEFRPAPKPTPSPAPENSLSPSESRTGEWLPEGMTPVAKVCDDHGVIRDGLTGTLLDDRDSQWRSECDRLTRENAQWKASQAKYDEALAQLDAQRDETDRLTRENAEMLPIVMAVQRAWPGETRAQTALKYVQQAEARANDPGQPAKQG